MKVHPNDKATQIRLMRKNIRRLQNYQKNPAVMDALARGALEQALARIEELEAEVTRLRAPTTAYVPCHSHRFHAFTMRGMATVGLPMRQVCPICEGTAESVSGPHL